MFEYDAVMMKIVNCTNQTKRAPTKRCRCTFRVWNQDQSQASGLCNQDHYYIMQCTTWMLSDNQ